MAAGEAELFGKFSILLLATTGKFETNSGILIHKTCVDDPRGPTTNVISIKKVSIIQECGYSVTFTSH